MHRRWLSQVFYYMSCIVYIQTRMQTYTTRTSISFWCTRNIRVCISINSTALHVCGDDGQRRRYVVNTHTGIQYTHIHDDNVSLQFRWFARVCMCVLIKWWLTSCRLRLEILYWHTGWFYRFGTILSVARSWFINIVSVQMRWFAFVFS